MERFQVGEPLGTGAQGQTILVTQKETDVLFVLKEIECKDESEANHAYREAVLRQQLRHEFICNIEEFFVTWKPDVCSVFLCIVSDYHKNGGLDSLLLRLRGCGEDLGEPVVMKYIGEIIDVMLLLEENGIYHADLKPSNILIQSDDNIAVCDFGLPTVMADLKTSTRRKLGLLNYMSPDIIDHDADSRSEVWSLGCVVLEMATCAVCDAALMTGRLAEIKHSTVVLEEILDLVQKTYSPELLDLIHKMLERDSAVRPTLTELLENEYVKQCRLVSRAALAERNNKHRSAEDCGLPSIVDGLTEFFKYLLENTHKEYCMIVAMEELVEATITKETVLAIGTAEKKIIMRIISQYVTNEALVTNACHVIRNFISINEPDSVLFTEGVLMVICQAMKQHPTAVELQTHAASILTAAAVNDVACDAMFRHKAVSCLLNSLRSSPDDEELCAICLNAFWSLMVYEGNAQLLTGEKGLLDVVRTMVHHTRSDVVFNAGCIALLGLATQDENLDLIDTLNCVGVVLDGLGAHSSNAKSVKNAFYALAALVQSEEESAFRVYLNEYNNSNIEGIPMLLSVFREHTDNVDVVVALVTLLKELAEYVEICSELKFLKVDALIQTEIQKRFKDEKSLMALCNATLEKMKELTS